MKRDIGIQYRHEKKEDIAGFILKPIARPEYGKYINIKACYYKIYIADEAFLCWCYSRNTCHRFLLDLILDE